MINPVKSFLTHGPRLLRLSAEIELLGVFSVRLCSITGLNRTKSFDHEFDYVQLPNGSSSGYAGINIRSKYSARHKCQIGRFHDTKE